MEQTGPDPAGNEENQNGRDPFAISTRVLAAAAAVFLLLLGVTIWALMDGGGDGDASGRQAEAGEVPAYEEYHDASLEQAVKEIDFALIRAMDRAGLSADDAEIVDIRRATTGGRDFLFQTIRLHIASPPGEFMETFRQEAFKDSTGVAFKKLSDAWLVSVNAVPTHRLILAPEPPAAPAMEPPPRKEPAEAGPRLAIVIDDLGENLAFAKKAAALGEPLTFAIWPRSTHAAEVTGIARKAGLDIIVHQPMEPRSYPETDPGPGALYVSMDAEAIRAVVEENLALIPDAIGMNNHMGSRFTEDAAGMDAVLAVLAPRGLFFLDSATTGASVVPAEAARTGVPVLVRDVFLDNVHDVEAIVLQLKKAERLALANGATVAICHPHPETLAALESWADERDTKIRLVAVSDLLSPAGRVAGTGPQAIERAEQPAPETAVRAETGTSGPDSPAPRPAEESAAPAEAPAHGESERSAPPGDTPLTDTGN